MVWRRHHDGAPLNFANTTLPAFAILIVFQYDTWILFTMRIDIQDHHRHFAALQTAAYVMWYKDRTAVAPSSRNVHAYIRGLIDEELNFGEDDVVLIERLMHLINPKAVDKFARGADLFKILDHAQFLTDKP